MHGLASWSHREATRSNASDHSGDPAPGTPAITPAVLRDWLGLPSTDTTPEAELRELFKLEAPLAVQSTTLPGLFPFNKFSAIPGLTRAVRLASTEADGTGPAADARKRVMIVPQLSGAQWLCAWWTPGAGSCACSIRSCRCGCACSPNWRVVRVRVVVVIVMVHVLVLDRRSRDGKYAEHPEAAAGGRAERERAAACHHARHRGRHATADRFVEEGTREPYGEHGLEVEQQRARRRAGAL